MKRAIASPSDGSGAWSQASVIRFVEPQTFLRDDFSVPIERQLGEDAVIRVVPVREKPRDVATEGPTDPVD